MPGFGNQTPAVIFYNTTHPAHTGTAWLNWPSAGAAPKTHCQNWSWKVQANRYSQQVYRDML